MATVISNYFKYLQALPDHADATDLEEDTIYGILVNDTFVFDPDTDKYQSDITGEVSGAGYTAGGFEIPDITVTQDDTNDLAYVDAPNVTLEDANFTARAVVLVKHTGTASTSVIIGYFDFGANKTASDGDFTIVWPSSGIFRYV